MTERKKSTKKPQTPLDTFSEKRTRGRPYKIRASEVAGRAYNYRIIFGQIWEPVGEELLKADSEEGVLRVLERTAYKEEFARILSLILKVLRDPGFPKRDKEARINFLANSLAARGAVTPRTSRDICAKEQAKERRKAAHRILRHEYYVECSCGYKGPARDNACRKCGSEIGFSLNEMMIRGPF